MPEFRSFAKIFQAPDCCQILVQRTYDDEEEQPLVQFSVYPMWVLGFPTWAERFPEVHRFWLPAHALPVSREMAE